MAGQLTQPGKIMLKDLGPIDPGVAGVQRVALTPEGAATRTRMAACMESACTPMDLLGIDRLIRRFAVLLD